MVSGTTDRYLKSDVALPVLYRIMEPRLAMFDLIPFVKEKTDHFVFQRDATMAADAKKETPAPFEDGAFLPEIDRSRKTTVADITSAKGFSIRLSRALIRDESRAEPELRAAYERAGFWMAEALNASMLAAMTAGATTAFTYFNPTVAWSDGACVPLEDLLALGQDMDRDGYEYKLTDAYVLKPCWNELNSYLFSLDVQGVTREMYGRPERPNRDTIRIPALDLDVHKLQASSGFADGYVLGIDSEHPGAEYHYYVDPKYGSASVSYPTIENGTRVEKTVPNFGIHFKQFEEDGSHDTILQFWYEGKTAVREPYALLYGSGI